MSDGTLLTLVAVTLAILVAGLFRLVTVLDSAELTLRRLVAGVWAARRALGSAGDLAAAVARDAAEGEAALTRLQNVTQGRHRPDRGTGPVSLPFRPGPAR